MIQGFNVYPKELISGKKKYLYIQLYSRATHDSQRVEMIQVCIDR